MRKRGVYETRIKERLAKLGKSQAWLSRVSGIDQRQISRLCSGRVSPGIYCAAEIVSLLKCDMEDLWKKRDTS